MFLRFSKFRKNLGFLFVLAFICSFVLVTYIPAQEGRSLEGLTISPTLIEREVKPGDLISLSLKVTNHDEEEDNFYLSTADFAADPAEGGSPYFIEDTSTDAFSAWVKLGKNKIVVKNGQRKEIPFTVFVPNDAEPKDDLPF